MYRHGEKTVRGKFSGVSCGLPFAIGMVFVCIKRVAFRHGAVSLS